MKYFSSTPGRLLLEILLCLGLYPQVLRSQILSSSNLPIIVIETKENEIPDEPKILGTMGIIDNGQGDRNHLNDPFNHYEGQIGIETRGNSTQGFDKKTYSLELRTQANKDTSVSLLGMGEEEDWILHAMVIDKSQLRIPMSFYLSRQMGHYAADWRYVELVLNGDYRGLYILTERIKRDKNRVDIAKLTDKDISGDDLTGGYILRIDWLEEAKGFESKYQSQGEVPMFYQWYYPKEENILQEQVAYIRSYITDFEDAVFSPSFSNLKGQRYDELIDVGSFIDFLLINELSKNADGYKLSSYLHKDKESRRGKLKAGPIWDFDQTYGVSLVCSNEKINGWTYRQEQDGCEDLESMPMWWRALMSDTLFVDRLRCRWDSLRHGPLHTDSLFHWIDTYQEYTSEAIVRNYQRWDGVIGEPIWIEPHPIPQSYEAEVFQLRSWLEQRLDWMDDHLGACGAGGALEEQIEFEEGFLMFPNPASANLSIQGKPGNQIHIVNLTGQKGLVVEQSEPIQQIDISHLSPGLYIVLYQGEDVLSEPRKLIIQRP